MKKLNTISVIGLGYIGLPTAAVLASRKFQVIGVDVNESTVDTINKGLVHIVEPDLDMIVHAAVTEGYLRATVRPEPADAFLVAVPTPFREGNHPDLKYIEAATRSIAPVLRKGNLVILESTSPVGTTEQMAAWLAEARPDLGFPQDKGDDADIRIAHCPERVLPGHVLRELVQNDRVIGGMTASCSAAAVQLYRAFVEGECIVTDARTAEMCKLTENSFRDVNIAFANELSLICDKLGIDVWSLIKLANRHPRVNILQPGPGVGGHCIAVDPWFIVSAAPNEAQLIRTAREVNDAKPHWVLEKVKEKVDALVAKNGVGFKPTIGCLGLAFKPNIDDLRESPALSIALQLSKSDMGRVVAVEPNVDALPIEVSEDIPLVEFNEALEVADIIVVLVDHREFLECAPKFRGNQFVIDTKGIWRQVSK